MRSSPCGPTHAATNRASTIFSEPFALTEVIQDVNAVAELPIRNRASSDSNVGGNAVPIPEPSTDINDEVNARIQRGDEDAARILFRRYGHAVFALIWRTLAAKDVIGHEMTHSFDDTGSRYDADGRQRMWWQSDDLAKFTAQSARLIEQFNRFQPRPSSARVECHCASSSVFERPGLSKTTLRHAKPGPSPSRIRTRSTIRRCE